MQNRRRGVTGWAKNGQKRFWSFWPAGRRRCVRPSPPGRTGQSRIRRTACIFMRSSISGPSGKRFKTVGRKLPPALRNAMRRFWPNGWRTVCPPGKRWKMPCVCMPDCPFLLPPGKGSSCRAGQRDTGKTCWTDTWQKENCSGTWTGTENSVLIFRRRSTGRRIFPAFWRPFPGRKG